ncbi:hypothetical protein N8Y76_01435 [Flavobacteriaceae bacterium]|nr:hypothetical protein [Flavobacteriaceae bacterium]
MGETSNRQKKTKKSKEIAKKTFRKYKGVDDVALCIFSSAPNIFGGCICV